MNKLVVLVTALIVSGAVLAADESKEKPIQHLKIADVESMAQAKEIFIDKTAEIKVRKKLDAAEAAQIHIITYTLEKSVAYFAQNLTGEKQRQAQDIAVVVEDIHLASEGNKLDELRSHVDTYFSLVDEFLFCF